MTKRLNICYDSELVERISSEFDLRDPNRKALRKLIFTLDGDYDPEVMQVVNIATGVGKTYLMAAFIEYLRVQGVRNVVIVTPGKTVQAKTVQNFTPGSPRYISGSYVPPDVVTPQDYSAWIAHENGGRIASGRDTPVLAFIFNIQQLIAPKAAEGRTHDKTEDAARRKPRTFDENAGVLFDYLKGLDDLVVIADESHLYSSSAVAFHAALEELAPAASIGLTASVRPGDHVIFEYKLYEAIRDQYVKAPVLAFRKGGYGDDPGLEEQQLRDALQLRRIKQAYYDAYAAQHGKSHLNAVVFVVCSDVDHATQVAALLRTPEYLGSSLAVLQVDSKHEDDITLSQLNGLDQGDSKVLAVVSVNKLKEGWDVKNIAIVVTLRAMASEVLTQQTMGRGLRLPFGIYTDVAQIDQLDIIAHQSFQELLSAENVLQQFGLEDAVADPDKAKVDAAIQKAAGQTDSQASTLEQGSALPSDSGVDLSNILELASKEEGKSPVPFTTDTAPISGTNGPATIGIRTIDAGSGSVTFIDPVVIRRNPRFNSVSYQFPVTIIDLKQPPIDLSDIDDAAISEAAKKVTSTGDVLFRKEIIASLGKKLHVVDTESAEVDSLPIEEADAKTALVKLVLDMQLVPSTVPTARYVDQFLVPKFMKQVTFSGWTVKSLGSARGQLQQLIKGYIDGVRRATKEVPTVHARTIRFDDYHLPLGDRIHEQIDSQTAFVRGRYYSGWRKSLYESESFDSFTGEYQLARLLNTSPSIQWWHRLHSYHNAYIYYNPKDRYFPDFVALDKDDVYWIIEGKAKQGRDDEIVQAKRKAAESLVRRLSIEEAFSGQHWGYLIAYEDDIAKAESWDDLKTLAQPVSNLI